MPGHARRPSAVSCAKMAEPTEMPFGLWTWVGSGKCVLHRVHIGAIWRLPVNRPSAATCSVLCQSNQHCSCFDLTRDITECYYCNFYLTVTYILLAGSHSNNQQVLKSNLT